MNTQNLDKSIVESDELKEDGAAEEKGPISVLGALYNILAMQPDIIEDIRQRFDLPINFRATEYIAINKIDAIFSYLSEQKNIPHIAFITGWNTPLASLGVFGFLIQSCSNIREAAAYMGHYSSLLPVLKAKPKLSIKGNDFITKLEEAKEGSNTHSVSADRIEFVLAIRIQFFLQLGGPQCLPKRVILTREVKETKAFIQDKLGITAETATTGQLVYDKNCLDLDIISANPNLKKVLRKEADQLVKERTEPSGFLDKIVYALSSFETLSSISTQSVSDAMHISERTLSRQCKKHDCSFRDLLTGFKHRRAIELLAEDQDVESIALQLGYADRSSFERAFKKWLGSTPSQFKQNASTIGSLETEIDLADPNSVPVMSSVGLEVIEIINQGDFDITLLTRTIMRDTVLTAKIIGLANSSYYGAITVSTLEDAVVKILGLEKVRNLALCIASNDCFTGPQLNQEAKVRHWTNSFAVAELASEIARKTGFNEELSAGELYLAGLMYNIGFLYLCHTRSGVMKNLLNVLEGEETYSVSRLCCLQHEYLGIDQYHVGAALLTHWGLPTYIIKLVKSMTYSSYKGPYSRSSQLLRNLDELSFSIAMTGKFDEERMAEIAIGLSLDEDKALECLQNFSSKYDELRNNAISLS